MHKEEIENEEMDETLDVDLATELLRAELPYSVEEDDGKEGNTQLSPVPTNVARELEDYASFRSASFHRARAGAAVETTTVGSDIATALRFLRYLQDHEGQSVPTVKLFASPQVGAWAQRYLEWLRTLGLMASSLAVYTNGIINMTGYALTLVSSPDACPIDELLNLRRQAESIAKQDRLFAPKSKTWLSWEAAQEARVKCFNAYHAARGQAKTALLRDCLVMAFHTLQPVCALVQTHTTAINTTHNSHAHCSLHTAPPHHTHSRTESVSSDAFASEWEAPSTKRRGRLPTLSTSPS